MAGRWNVLLPHAVLTASLSEGKYSHSLCLPHALSPYAVRSISCGGRTRLAGWRNLPALHAALKVSPPESKCSLMLCRRTKSVSALPHFHIQGVWGRAAPE